LQFDHEVIPVEQTALLNIRTALHGVWMRQKKRGIASMAHEITVCFRFGKTMDQRINSILCRKYQTRSRFIRAAIEHLLSKEEAQSRLQAAQQTLHWR
jgi:hypothetical protein